MSDPSFTDFEQGERQALLEVRSFILKHGLKEVDAYCAQRLHDIRMDARHRTLTPRPRLEHTGNDAAPHNPEGNRPGRA